VTKKSKPGFERIHREPYRDLVGAMVELGVDGKTARKARSVFVDLLMACGPKDSVVVGSDSELARSLIGIDRGTFTRLLQPLIDVGVVKRSVVASNGETEGRLLLCGRSWFAGEGVDGEAPASEDAPEEILPSLDAPEEAPGDAPGDAPEEAPGEAPGEAPEEILPSLDASTSTNVAKKEEGEKEREKTAALLADSFVATVVAAVEAGTSSTDQMAEVTKLVTGLLEEGGRSAEELTAKFQALLADAYQGQKTNESGAGLVLKILRDLPTSPPQPSSAVDPAERSSEATGLVLEHCGQPADEDGFCRQPGCNTFFRTSA